MKTIAAFVSFALLTSAYAPQAASVSGTAPTPNYIPADRGADFQNWEEVTSTTNANGTVVLETNLAYVELQTSMHYWESNAWQNSQELVESYPGGAIARHSGHKVVFANNLNTTVAIDMFTPDGKELQSHLLALAYFDSASGKSIILATVTNSFGQILPPNQVIYTNAFPGLADVLFTYTKAGFEQDVILRAKPPLPETFGLSPATTKLELLTEFVNPPQPAITTTLLPASAGGMPDQTLNFGAMTFVQGRAFLAGSPQDTASGIPVAKQWVVAGGRTVLFEEVPFSRIAAKLNSLPAEVLAQNEKPRIVNLASANWLPAAPKTTETGKTPMRLAKLSAPGTGFVLDYQTLTGSRNNFTFQGDTTYYISGLLYLYGTSTFEGGAVLKYATNGSVQVMAGQGLSPAVNWQGADYRPVIFTAKDDNTVGEAIFGSSGNPANFSYGNPMLLCSGVYLPGATMSGLRFCYAGAGIQLAAATAGITNAQFVNCGASFVLTDGSLLLGNALFKNARTNFIFQGGFTVVAQNVTFDTSTFVGAAPSSSSGCDLFLTNCVFVSESSPFWGTFDNATIDYSGFGDYNGFYNSLTFGTHQVTSPVYPFQSVGAGNHYLAVNMDGSDATQFRGAGTPTIDGELLAGLRKKTTHKPQLLPAASVQDGTTWSLRAARDTGCSPDLGYHYDALDYLVNGQSLSGTLALDYNVAVGIYGAYGFQNGTLSSTGTPLKHNHLCLYTAVQEQPNSTLGSVSATYFMNPSASTALKLRFTDLLLAGSAQYLGGQTVNAITVADCYLHRAKMNIQYVQYGYYWGHAFTNNILDRCYFSYACLNYPGYPVTFCNNLFLNSSVVCACFGNASLAQNISLINNLFFKGFLTCCNSPLLANNGYYNCSVSGGYGTNPKLVSDPDFQPGPLGPYYYPATGNNLHALVDAGSMSAIAAGLADHSTRKDYVADENAVDIGFHYAGVGTCGTDFWLAFPSSPTRVDPFPDILDISVYISSPSATSGTLSIPALGGQYDQSFSVASGGVTKVTIPLAAMAAGSDSIEGKGVHIIADQPVAVYEVYFLRTVSTALTGYPTPMLGTDYCLLARSGFQGGYPSEFAVVATEDDTTITIKPSPSAELYDHPGMSPFDKVLQKGQIYQATSVPDATIGDVTGTWVSSDKPIGVFAGSASGMVPDSWGYANPVLQEQLPVASWGTQAVGFQFLPRYLQGDFFRILAAYDNTVISINGTAVATLQAGEFYENPMSPPISGPVEFCGTRPIQVAQFAHGGKYDAVGDPCEILLPPIGSYMSSYIITTPTEPDPGNPDFTANYLNLVVETTSLPATLLDGSPMPASAFQPIGCTGYSGARIPVSRGSHTVSGPRPMQVQAYGFGYDDAYGYFGGAVIWPVY